MIDDTIEDARLVQKNLKGNWHDAEHKQATKIINRDEAESRADDAQASYQKVKKKRENLEADLATLDKQIESLKQENDEVDEKLRKRETDLYKYRFKIKDLNKSKQVLTHRTYEMRNNL